MVILDNIVILRGEIMNVNIEFFSEEALENIATCLSYSIDKVIYVGYLDNMKEADTKKLSSLVKEILDVKHVEFVSVTRHSLPDAISTLENIVTSERQKDNVCYFDLTGGDDLILVAGGIVAERLRVAMHQIDLSTGILYEHSPLEDKTSILSLKKNTHILSINDYMRFRGTCVNSNMHKDFKSHIDDDDFVNDIKKLWNISCHLKKKWNLYGKYFRTTTLVPIEDYVLCHLDNGDDANAVFSFIKRLAKIGVILDLRIFKRSFKFKYKNQRIKDCLCDSGSILELYTYLTAMETGFFDSCDVGVHLDWDGTMNGWRADVTNEIDGLIMKNNIPTFISCKNGRIDSSALYELDAVTSELGGKYAKKLIISTQYHDQALIERAKEMDIVLTNRDIYKWNQDEFGKFLTNIYKDMN